MREIKFRAWVPHLKKMGAPWDMVKDLTRYDPEHDPYATFFSDTVFLQYTGLKDKNGREIYEGDILNEKQDRRAPGGGYFAGTFGFHPENAVVVEWRDGCFICDYIKPLATELDWRKRWGGLEVIGNIHENPDLLNPPVEEAHGGGKPNA
jgi:uncharacterized phage protein (TIGR01671 family)